LDVHDTLRNESATGRFDHDVFHREPFQSLATAPAPPELLTPPTTMHAVTEVHETPSNPLEKPSKHLRSEIDQRLAFQRSATETPACWHPMSRPTLDPPIAMQTALDVQETAENPVSAPSLAGVGVRRIDQFRAFQCSVSGDVSGSGP
jgi:hypothetical protein